MIKHVVCWKVRKFADAKQKAENLKTMEKMLLSLKNLPMVRYIEVGINSPKGDITNFDIVLITQFNSFGDLQEYQNHPEHKKVSEFVSKIRVSRVCVDYEI
jgi:hypothetical protein